MTDEAASRIQALNIDGAFFSKRCAEEFRRGGRWQVIAEEHPVFYPRHGGAGERLESAADIIAAAPSGWGPRAYLCVECKKADSRFREWVFFRKFGQHHRFRAPALFRKTPNADPTRILLGGNLVGTMCDYGRELTVKEKAHSTNPASNRIHDAAQQSALAVRSFCDELLDIAHRGTVLKGTRPLAWPAQDQRLDFIPMVLTTAKLLICDFPMTGVDVTSGALDPKVGDFKECPWLIYDYPLIGGLGFSSDDVEPVNIEAGPLEAFTKMPIIFLQSAGLEELAKTGKPVAELLEGW